MPPRRSTPKTLHRAGALRKQTTPAETKLWTYLRRMRADGVRFRRQHAIGAFITDFCAPRNKLIIELDGSQHLEREEYDREPKYDLHDWSADSVGAKSLACS